MESSHRKKNKTKQYVHTEELVVRLMKAISCSLFAFLNFKKIKYSNFISAITRI